MVPLHLLPDLATASGLSSPTDIAFDATGNFYIADANNNLVEMVTIATGDISIISRDRYCGI